MPEGDGVLQVELGTAGEESQQETKTMEPTIAAVLQQGFANCAQMFQQSSARFNASTELTANEAARMFQLETQLVGAKAAGQLDRDALAFGILQANSARDQPGANKGQ